MAGSVSTGAVSPDVSIRFPVRTVRDLSAWLRASWQLWVGLELAVLVTMGLLQLNVPTNTLTGVTSALYAHAYGVQHIAVPHFWAVHDLLLVALWVVYLFGIRALGSSRASRTFWLLTGGLISVSTLMPPVLSSDVFYYAITGQEVAQYHVNPYAVPPAAFAHSPLLSFNYWTHFTTPYGPAWTSVSAMLLRLTGDSPFWSTMAFKLLSAVCVASTAWLIYRTLSRESPEGVVQAVALFAWNPQVLLDGVGSAHNDATMALLLVGAAAVSTARLARGPYLLMLAAALVKVTALPVIGLYVLSRLGGQPLRRQLPAAVGMAGLTLVLMAAAYAPYWAGLSTLQDLAAGRLRLLTGFLPDMAFRLGSLTGSPTLASTAAVDTMYLGLLALAVGISCYAWRLVRGGYRGARNETLVWGSFFVVFGMVVISALPWYALPGLGLLALSWRGRAAVVQALYMGSALWFLLQNLI